ncbi:MAG: DUF948 domain-containing protein [Acidimicrobiales bacterium]
MSGGEVAALIAAVAGAMLVVALLFVLSSLTKTLRAVRTTVEDFRAQALPLLVDLRGTVDRANSELERVDGVLGRAETIGGTLDSASRLAYLAFSNPLIKALALGAGTSRAARRLRRRKPAG